MSNRALRNLSADCTSITNFNLLFTTGLSEGSRRKSMKGMTHFLLLRKQFLQNNGEHVAVHTQLRRLFSYSRLRSEKALPQSEKAQRSGAPESHRAQDPTFGALGKQAASPDPLPKGCLVTRRVSKNVWALWEERREHGPDADWFQRSGTSVPKRLLGGFQLTRLKLCSS